MKRHRSHELFERACRSLVGGVNSPVRSFRAVGGRPVFIERGEGPFVFDADGNRYIDLVCGWGSCLLGHAYRPAVEAVIEAARKGLGFGACCEVESRLAEIIIGAIPSIELIRFVSSGTEAAMSAIRLARAVTGRTKVLKFAGGYHGHADSLLVASGSGAATLGIPDSAGVPQAIAATTIVAPYNDLSAVENAVNRFGADLAAILVEPIAGNMGFVPPVDGFLQGLRSQCDRCGALLIFDEVMTGFRVAWGGYQKLCGIRPDITVLGKVIGGGMPVAAYGGSSKLMSHVSPLGSMYQAGTLSGNPVAMAAGIATLEACNGQTYRQLERITEALAIGLREKCQAAGIEIQAECCGGLWGMTFSPRPVRNFEDAKSCDHARYAEFFHAMLDRGVNLPPSGYEAMFVTAAHESVIDQVLEAAADSIRSLRR